MVHICSLCKRKNEKTKGISFHRFPVNHDQRTKWIEITGITNPNQWAVLCSDHFDENSFDHAAFGTCRRLKKNAVPINNILSFERVFVMSQPSTSTEYTESDLLSCSQQSSTSSASSSSSSQKETPVKKNAKTIRYVGDIKSEELEFASTEQLKKAVKVSKYWIKEQRNQIRVLHQNKRRLQQRIKNLEELVTHLKNKFNVTDTAELYLQPRTKRDNISPVEELSQINKTEVSHPEVKVDNTYTLMEPRPTLNIKQEENSDEEFNVSNTSSNNDVNISEFIVPDTNISSKQINFIDKQTNNVVTLTNVNPILSHNECGVFMVTAKNDSATTNKAISSTELSTINTEVDIKTEIPDEEEIHNDTTVVSEEHMVPVTQDESYKPVQTNTLILKNNLLTTSNKKTLVKNNRGPDKTIISSRNNTMSTEDCTTSADKSEAEIEHYAAGVIRNILEIERKEHRSKVGALQTKIRRLKKLNKKLKESKKK